MALLRGRLFAGALFAGALFGATESVEPPPTPTPPPSMGGGGGYRHFSHAVSLSPPRKLRENNEVDDDIVFIIAMLEQENLL